MEVENNAAKIKRGYLHKDFEFFHIKDKKNMDFEFHYHEFSKIIIFISGEVTYLIEGKSYKLKPWDILFVSSNDVHKAVISADKIYERIVIWVNTSFLEMHNTTHTNLMSCFELSTNERINLLRLTNENISKVKLTVQDLENAMISEEFGSDILRNAIFIQLIIYLTRLYMGMEIQKEDSSIEYDKRVSDILVFINENLNNELSIELIASKFYLNKYYLMHKFKDQTGYTIHSYIQQKRLLKAASEIKKGKQVTEVYLESGFGDYSSFVRAFKKNFGLSPKKYYKAISEIENSYKNKKHQG